METFPGDEFTQAREFPLHQFMLRDFFRRPWGFQNRIRQDVRDQVQHILDTNPLQVMGALVAIGDRETISWRIEIGYDFVPINMGLL